MILIASEGGGFITPKSWQDDIGTRFPVQIEKVRIRSIACSSGGEKVIDVVCTSSYPGKEDEWASFSIGKADGSNEFSSFRVKSDVYNLNVNGTMQIYAADKKYEFSVKID